VRDHWRSCCGSRSSGGMTLYRVETSTEWGVLPQTAAIALVMGCVGHSAALSPGGGRRRAASQLRSRCPRESAAPALTVTVTAMAASHAPIPALHELGR
jgi:hypothetical protein